MPVSCAAVGCTNRFIKGSEIRFYRFPISKPQLASQWVQSLGRKAFIPTPNSCLCSEHFEPDCFRDYNGRQFLREDAVPTIFTTSQSPGPDTMKIELRKNRGGIAAKDAIKVPANQFNTLSEKEKFKEREKAKLRTGEKRQKLKETTAASFRMPPISAKITSWLPSKLQLDFYLY